MPNAASNVWNQVAEQYTRAKIPTWIVSEVLRLIDKTVHPDHTHTALDIGCGAGTYSIALAQRTQRVLGIDSSSAMVQVARENARSCGIDNASFEKTSFQAFDAEKCFDIVFARLTPGVSSRADLRKMESLSRRWCVYESTANRYDTVLETAESMAGVSPIQRGNHIFAEINELTNTQTKQVFSRNYRQNWPLPKSREENRWYYESVARSEGRSDDETSAIAEAADQIYAKQLVKPEIVADMRIVIWDVMH